MKYECITKCFYQNRLWTPGETLESSTDAEVPKHFKVMRNGESLIPKVELPPEPKTLHELQMKRPVPSFPVKPPEKPEPTPQPEKKVEQPKKRRGRPKKKAA